MTGLPESISIAVWLVGSIWLVALLARRFDKPGAIVYAAFGVGIVAGIVEWFAIARRGR